MAVLRDVMPPFELYQPTDVGETVELLARTGPGTWILAGGLDSLEWLKDRIKRPGAVVDLGRVAALRGVREWEGGLEIGAMTTLTEVARHPAVGERFGLLARAAEAVGSPQIRNQGTLGGNLSQDARCWYYRSGLSCRRAGGNICYASAPEGMNREHAIFGASRCVAVSPSDTAPALTALGARMVVASAAGTREIEAGDYFMRPDVDPTRMTALEPGDLLVAARIPADFAGARQYFEKVRDRQVWDFPLVNIAAAMTLSGGAIRRARLVLGGVAARPWRLDRAEDILVGRAPDEASAELAGAAAAEGARPLGQNGYKVALARNLVKRAVRGQEAS